MPRKISSEYVEVVGHGQWRGKSVLEMRMDSRPNGGRVTFTAADQQSGATGSCLVRLVLKSPRMKEPMLQVLTRVNATLSQYSFDLSQSPVVKEARAGDVIALEIVSAPWPAWKCVCTKAEMIVNTGGSSEGPKEARTVRRRSDKKMTIVGNGAWKAGNYMGTSSRTSIFFFVCENFSQ